jgi:DHA2 family multidrug resistance protein-like MFS transporter
MLAPPLVQRVRPAFLMSGGLVLAALGFLLFTRIDSFTGFWTFALGSTAFSLGMAPVFTLTTDLVVGSAPQEKAGAASAISETSAEFGGALGIAVFGSIGVAVYRSAMSRAIPAGVPADVADAARATLGGAIDAARGLSPELGAPIIEAAQAAFVRGLQLCAGISTAGSLLLAVLVAVALRNARANSEHAAEDSSPEVPGPAKEIPA